MNKALGVILLFLCTNKLESMDKKEIKKCVQIADQKNQNNNAKKKPKEEGCLFCCSKTDCTKNFK